LVLVCCFAGCAVGEAEDPADDTQQDVGKADGKFASSATASVERYSIQLAIDDAAGSYAARTTLSLQLAQPTSSITLDLGAEATVDAVGGDAASFRHRQDRLTVGLARQFPAGPATVTVDSHGALGEIRKFSQGCPAKFGGLMRLTNRYGDRLIDSFHWPSYAHRWIPSHDHPSDGAAVELTIIVDGADTVVANGRLLGVVDHGDGRRSWHFSEPGQLPIYGLHVSAFPFVEEDLGTAAGVPVHAYLFPQDAARNPRFDDALGNLNFLAQRIAPYPWQKYDMSVAPTCVDGMEEIGAITLDQSLFGDGNPDHLRNVSIHEVVHQWMGDAVRIASWNDFWINEGFAQQLTALYLGHAYGADEQARFLSAEWATAHQAEARASADHPVRPPGPEGNVDAIFDDISYSKADWMLNSLRLQVGDDAFWAGVRRFYQDHQFQAASTPDLQAAFEAASGRDLDWFFRQFIYTEFHPQLRGQVVYDAARGVASVTIAQKQTRGASVYQLPLAIDLVGANGERQRASLALTLAQQTVEIPASFRATHVVIDPDETLYVDVLCASRLDCPSGRVCHTGDATPMCAR
jgi:aminopeptidase N